MTAKIIPFPKKKPDTFDTRIQRIRDTLEQINQNMQELKGGN